jgi:hypothetical protein
MILGMLCFWLSVSAVTIQAQEPGTKKKLGIISLREILKQVPLQDLARHCKTNGWGDAYSRINTRILELNHKLEEARDEKLDQTIRDQRYRLENERSQLEGNIRNIQENVVRQFIAEEFRESFPVILNKDTGYEILLSELEVSDLTHIAVTVLQAQVVEKIRQKD